MTVSATRLVHFSGKPLGAIRSTEQEDKPHFKPRGLWISVEGPSSYGWSNWCEAERFGLESLTHPHEIVLHADARILCLAGARAIDRFSKTYLKPQWSRSNGLDDTYSIDWQRVAAEHQGILIAPYCWPRRLHRGTSWYYCWDWASGCIWDADAIAAVHALPPIERRQEEIA